MTDLNLPPYIKFNNDVLVPSNNYQQCTEFNEHGFITLKAEDDSSITIMREPNGKFAVMASVPPVHPMYKVIELDHEHLEHQLNKLNRL
jgi:hypothetical protein